MAITQQLQAESTQQNNTSFSQAVTLGAGSNRLFLVAIVGERTSYAAPSSVTYGGNALSLVTDGSQTAENITGSFGAVHFYVLKEANLPANGSNTLAVNYPGAAVNYVVGWWILEGVSQGNSRDVKVLGQTTTATSITVTLDSGATTDAVICAAYKNDSTGTVAITISGAGVTEDFDVDLTTGGARGAAGTDLPAVASGTIACVATVSSTSRRIIVAIRLIEAEIIVDGSLNLPAVALSGDFTVAGGSADPPEFISIQAGPNGGSTDIVGPTTSTYLLVVSAYRSAAVGSGATATFNGVAMDVANNSNAWAQVFYMLNPPEVNGVVSVTGASISEIVTVQYENIHSFSSASQGSVDSHSFSPGRRALLTFSMASGGSSTPLTDTEERYDTGGDCYSDRIVTSGGTFEVGASDGNDPDSVGALFLGLEDSDGGVDIDPSSLTYPALTVSGSFTVAITVTGSLALPSLDLTGTETTAVAASGSLTLPSLDLAGSETTAVAASGSLVLPSLDLAGTETTAVQAQGSLALPALQLSGTETTAVAASGALSLPALQLSGSVALATTGALALPALQLSGAFTVSVAASGALVLPSLDLSGSETTAVATSGALALPALQLAGSEQTAVAASGSLALPSLDLDGSETTQVSASGTLALPALALAGSFTVGVTVTGTVSLPALQLSGSETTAVAASGSLTLPELELTSEFTVADPNTITGLLQLPALQLSGQFTVAVQASGALALPSLDLSGTETTAVAASGALGLPALQLSGSETTAVQASGTLTLPALTLSGTVAPETPNEVAGSLALPVLTVTGSFTVTVAASGALQLPAVTVTGSVAPVVMFTGDLALPAIQLSGSEQTLVTVGGNEVTLPALNQTGSVSVAVSVSGALTLGSLTIDGSVQPIPDAGLPGTGVITTQFASAVVTLSSASAEVTTTLMVSHIVTESGSAKT